MNIGKDMNIGLIHDNKAFDFISHEFLQSSLKNQGTPLKFIELIYEIYEENES